MHTRNGRRQFATAATAGPEGLSLHSSGMAVGVVVGTVLVLSMALAGAAFDERARLLALEQHARGEAEAANRLKDEFLATCRTSCERR